jgi:hypothetical protein
MSSQSITNKLVANIKQTSKSNITTINNEKVICIDSSKNALGINTLNPIKALTISGGDNSFNAVHAPYLYITNSGNIQELTTNSLFSNDASINDLSLINLDVSFISVLKADISNLDVSNITINSNFLHVQTISCDNLSVINLDVSTIDCSFGIFTKVVANDICFTDTNIALKNVTTQYLIVNISADISFLECNTISAETISCNIVDISFIKANSMTIENDLSINKLNVTGNSVFTSVSAGSIEISGSNIDDLITNKVNTRLTGNTQNASFNNASFNDVNIGNELTMTSSGRIYNGIFNPTSLIIPGSPDNSQNNANYMYFDGTSNLHIGSRSIPFINNIIYLTCDNDISGQRPEDFSFNNTQNRYNVYNYNNLEIQKPNSLTNKYNNYSFKFIPLKFLSSTTFSTDNSKKYLEIKNTNTDASFELYANVSLQFYNKIPNDVELNNYIFGVCDISNSNDDYLYTSIQNSIMVFDNSFNYANSSINYYGLFNNTNPRLQFFVGSIKDNSFIYIDSLSATIKF